MGYLCANFSLPRPLCSRLIRPDVRDVHQTSDSIIALNGPAYGAGHKNDVGMIEDRGVLPIGMRT